MSNQQYPMDYATALQSLKKYGRLDDDSVDDFVQQGVEGDISNAHNSADAIFADKLQDHDDPRHDLVRQDLAMRAAPGTGESYYLKYRQAAVKKYGERGRPFGADEHIDMPTPNYPRGRLTVRHIVSDQPESDGKLLGHEVDWHPHSEHIFSGHYSPEELDLFMGQLGLPHTSESLHTAARKKLYGENI